MKKEGRESEKRGIGKGISINFWKLGVALVFTVLGIFLVRYALTLPCEVGGIMQETSMPSQPGMPEGKAETVVEFPSQLEKMLCLSTDFKAVICMLVGVVMIIAGVPGVFRGLTGK